VSHKELARRWLDVINRHDFEACRAIAADVYIEHALSPFGQTAPGAVNGPLHLQEAAEWLLAQFPDLKLTMLALVAEGDMVALRVRSEGTNLGPIDGTVRETGRHFDSEQSHWFRVEHNRLVEHWATRDDLSTMLQLGLVTPPGLAAAATGGDG
jgi:predicted ester cyclase